MFIGREKELAVLERLYSSEKFEYLVMYGRRRVGKTEILKEFCKSHSAIFFSAIEKKSNLDDFGKCVLSYYGENVGLKFSAWKDAFTYISDRTGEEKTVVIVDEFPYIVKEESEVKSILQHTIDHIWKEKNILLILCGSSVSFMTNKIMGKKSPLYGRNTSVMEVLPFDYQSVSKFLPAYSAEDKLIVYGILGGVPYYLSQFSDGKSLKENISDKIIESSSTLREEPITLLKSELREPATYNSIMEAMASGANRLNEIAAKTGIASSKISVYMKNLKDMRLIDKVTPCGRKGNGKISHYVIADNFFAFWYRFIFARSTIIELTEPSAFTERLLSEMPDHMGLVFEKICLQYIKIQAKRGELPFIPERLGKWWGTNPATKSPDDIDILGIDGDKYLFCECKFRNEKFDLEEFKDLVSASDIFSKATERYYYIFVKSGFTQAVIDESKKYNVRLITIDEMF